MVGMSKTLRTKQDWLNTHEYVLSQSDQSAIEELKHRLIALRNSGTMLVLKNGIDKDPEEQTPEDFISVPDPGSQLVRSGLTISEIDEMVAGLSGQEE